MFKSRFAAWGLRKNVRRREHRSVLQRLKVGKRRRAGSIIEEVELPSPTRTSPALPNHVSQPLQMLVNIKHYIVSSVEAGKASLDGGYWRILICTSVSERQALLGRFRCGILAACNHFSKGRCKEAGQCLESSFTTCHSLLKTDKVDT